jgi:hypothetical protein
LVDEPDVRKSTSVYSRGIRNLKQIDESVNRGIGADKDGQLRKNLVEPRGVAPGPQQLELPRFAIEAGLRSPDDPVADKER